MTNESRPEQPPGMRSEPSRIPHDDLPPGMGGGEGYSPQAYQAQPGALQQHSDTGYRQGQATQPHYQPNPQKQFKVGQGSPMIGIGIAVVGLIIVAFSGGFSLLLSDDWYVSPLGLVVGLAVIVSGVAMVFKKN